MRFILRNSNLNKGQLNLSDLFIMLVVLFVSFQLIVLYFIVVHVYFFNLRNVLNDFEDNMGCWQ